MRLTISIPKEVKKKLLETAKKDRRSISNCAVRILEKHLDSQTPLDSRKGKAA